ncbi:nicotinate phosphoribosyltransferase [soil metagenome]
MIAAAVDGLPGGLAARYTRAMTMWTPPAGTDGVSSSALLTDHYELTGLDAALASGVAHHRAVFEVFARQLPEGRRYGVVAGMARAVDAVTRFRFGDEELAFLRERAFLRPETLDWLADYRFGGDLDGYHDGEVFFPHSPVLTVEATFGEALILETLLLSILNHDSAVAAAGARMTEVACGRTSIEGGGRRTHEEAAVAAALAAYIAGIDVTSNLEAGRRFGLPTAGTTMHAFTLAHPSEEAAFAAQVAALGRHSTFLVDTYDTTEGIRRAVAAAGPEIGAVRLDSGDLGAEAHRARAQLDALGASGCQIVASGDLDEYRIADLASAPIDRYLIGTRLVTGSGAPTGELVYKLVAVADRPGEDAPLRTVAKTSTGKGHRGGRKVATRVLDADGFAVAERVVGPDDRVDPVAPDHAERGLQTPWMRNGNPLRPFSAEAARAHHAMARHELRPEARSIAPGPAALVGEATPPSTPG